MKLTKLTATTARLIDYEPSNPLSAQILATPISPFNVNSLLGGSPISNKRLSPVSVTVTAVTVTAQVPLSQLVGLEPDVQEAAPAGRAGYPQGRAASGGSWNTCATCLLHSLTLLFYS